MNYQYVNTDALEAAIKAVAGEAGVEIVETLYEAIDAVEREAVSEGFEAGLEAAGVGTTTPQVEGFSYGDFFDADDDGDESPFDVPCDCPICRADYVSGGYNS